MLDEISTAFDSAPYLAKAERWNGQNVYDVLGWLREAFEGALADDGLCQLEDVLAALEQRGCDAGGMWPDGLSSAYEFVVIDAHQRVIWHQDCHGKRRPQVSEWEEVNATQYAAMNDDQVAARYRQRLKDIEDGSIIDADYPETDDIAVMRQVVEKQLAEGWPF